MTAKPVRKHGSRSNPAKTAARIPASVALLLLLMASMEQASAQLRPGFMSGTIDAEPAFHPGEYTVGWDFGVNSLQPVLITHLGIYDIGGDGLNSAHEVGIWGYRLEGAALLASTVIPEGTSAELIGGYRYVPITPILLLPLQQSFVLGATYSTQDQDEILKPIQGTFAPEIRGGGEGKVVAGPSLQVPVTGVSRGQEGLPNYEFYHVNFLFQVVPEPQVTGLLILGLSGIFFLTRRY